MTLLRHRGFQGSAKYEDGVFRLRVLHIDDLVIDDVTDSKLVESTFRDLVDDYIETCEAVGKSPNKPFSGSFNVRIDCGLHERAAKAASAEEISLNQWVEAAIRDKVRADPYAIHLDYQRRKAPVLEPQVFGTTGSTTSDDGFSLWDRLIREPLAMGQHHILTFAHRKGGLMNLSDPAAMDVGKVRLAQVARKRGGMKTDA